jgi:zinc and cadmium transporter
MSLLSYIIVFSLVGGLASLSLASSLLINAKVAEVFARYAMPFAAGALLATVFLDLFIDGLETNKAEPVMIAALVGIVLFFIAERFIRWFHHHHQHGEEADPAIPLLITGDIVHNTLDGVAIAAAFLISIPAGIVTTVAVAAHELPKEVGQFGAMLGKGMSRGKVLFWNIVASLSAVVAAVLTYFLGSSQTLPLGAIFGLSAGFLLYIALSDIIPSLHENSHKKHVFDWQPLLLLAGIGLVALATWLVHGLA